jgi:hypothetical protein
MQKIIILSLHKNGITSLVSYFIELGYFCFQYDFDHEFRSKIEEKRKIDIINYIKAIESRYEVLSDIPVNIMYEYFDIKYPDAKFILMKRGIDSWIKSVRNNYFRPDDILKEKNHVPFIKIDRLQYEKYIPNLPHSMDLCTDEDLVKMYHSHIESIERYFQGRENKLLTLELEESDKELKINEFLNIKSTSKFPWKNKTIH